MRVLEIYTIGFGEMTRSFRKLERIEYIIHVSEGARVWIEIIYRNNKNKQVQKIKKIVCEDPPEDSMIPLLIAFILPQYFEIDLDIAQHVQNKVLYVNQDFYLKVKEANINKMESIIVVRTKMTGRIYERELYQ